MVATEVPKRCILFAENSDFLTNPWKVYKLPDCRRGELFRFRPEFLGTTALVSFSFQISFFRLSVLQITSANVFSVFRKYQMPIPRNRKAKQRERMKEGSCIRDSPSRIAQRKPSMTPTTGLSE